MELEAMTPMEMFEVIEAAASIREQMSKICLRIATGDDNPTNTLVLLRLAESDLSAAIKKLEGME